MDNEKQAVNEPNTINVDEFLSYCERTADTIHNMQDKIIKNLERGESEDSELGAVAYFAQQETIFRYNIPRILRGFMQRGDVSDNQNNNGGLSETITDDNLTELKGQLVDIVEDYLTEKCVPDKDAVFIKGDDYDRLADRFAETLKNWNLI